MIEETLARPQARWRENGRVWIGGIPGGIVMTVTPLSAVLDSWEAKANYVLDPGGSEGLYQLSAVTYETDATMAKARAAEMGFKLLEFAEKLR